MTDRLEDYRRNVHEAERRAFCATHPGEREAYLEIAKGWRDLIKSVEGRDEPSAPASFAPKSAD